MPPITYPVSNLIKWGIRAAGAAGGTLEGLGYLGLFDPDEVVEQDPVEWRRLQITWIRSSPSGTTEDTAITTFDLVNFTDGEVDASWTTGDYSAAETLFVAWFQAIKAKLTSNHSLATFRWYPCSFPVSSPHGGPLRVSNYNQAGTASTTNTLPYQVAMSVTERTNVPRSWGRFYLPGILDTAVDAYGRWNASDVDTITDATETLYEGLIAAQLNPVVPMSAASTLLPVEAIQVDDIPDVQRRRRPRTTLFRDYRALT